MKRRIIQIFMVVILLGMVAYWGNEYKIYAVHGKAESDHKDNERQIEPLGEKGKEEDGLDRYYGTYRIIEFCPTMYWYNFSFDCLTKQEADMMLGRIVEIQENLLVTYDSLRRLGTRDGRDAFPGNHVIEQISIENPQYEWLPFSADIGRVGRFLPPELWKYREEIEGEMSVQIAEPFGEHHYLALKDKLIMYSTLTDSFFLLEKWDTKTDDAVSKSNLSEEEKRTLLQEVYGTYSVIAFMPTKFYPALDSGGDVRLPVVSSNL